MPSFKSVSACRGVLVTERRGEATEGSGQSSVSSKGFVPERNPRAVQAAAVELRAYRVEDRVGLVVAGTRDREVRGSQVRPDASRGRLRRRARRRERTRPRALLRPPPDKAVIGVDRGRFPTLARRLSIGGRRHDQALNPLQAPRGAVRRAHQLAGPASRAIPGVTASLLESQNRWAYVPGPRRSDSPRAG